MYKCRTEKINISLSLSLSLSSSGGLFATKMGLKTPFEIRIVTKFSTFYGMYRHFPHKFTHFFVVTDVFALFDIFLGKSAT